VANQHLLIEPSRYDGSRQYPALIHGLEALGYQTNFDGSKVEIWKGQDDLTGFRGTAVGAEASRQAVFRAAKFPPIK
jgi:hypothetical protein